MVRTGPKQSQAWQRDVDAAAKAKDADTNTAEAVTVDVPVSGELEVQVTVSADQIDKLEDVRDALVKKAGMYEGTVVPAEETQAVSANAALGAIALRASAADGVSPEALHALAENRHSDPHTVLGVHALDRLGGELSAVRALQPNAASVTLVLEKDDGTTERMPMKALPYDGVFEAKVPQAPGFRYHYEVTTKDGGVKTLDDPYRLPVTVSEQDMWLFAEGKLRRSAELNGAHEMEVDGVEGFNFVTWAPNAHRVSVMGDFNEWENDSLPMRRLGESGLWEVFVPGAQEGDGYKFELESHHGEVKIATDPYARARGLRPDNTSLLVGESNFEWSDDDWMVKRAQQDPFKTPVSLYEVHLPSWQRDENGDFLSWDDLGDKLIPYLKDKSYNAVELMGLLEHALDDSWGYLVTGFYAPTSRHGDPEGLKRFVDRCHQEDIRVIFDWVPGHFPQNNPEALAEFDFSNLYSHEDDRLGLHKEWGARTFNYGRGEVQSFLLGNLHHWLEEYHLDGFRTDAVSGMIFRDYQRSDGEWIPNQEGGRENHEAIAFLREATDMARKEFPGVMSFAEESTIYQGVTKSPDETDTGLGFDFKWNMGWMHDTLNWFKQPHEARGQNMDQLTNTMLWKDTENFTLAISHDEVVYGKGSLLEKMPGDDWQKFANLRMFLGYMWSYPGNKLLFMGQEFAQRNEWDFKKGIDMHLEDESSMHGGVAELLTDLNKLYTSEPAMFEKQYDADGFDLRVRDTENAVVGLVRRGNDPKDNILFLHNATQHPRETYRVGVDAPGKYDELINTDDEKYGGSGVNNGQVEAEAIPAHGKPYSIEVTLPPLGSVAFKRAG